MEKQRRELIGLFAGTDWVYWRPDIVASALPHLGLPVQRDLVAGATVVIDHVKPTRHLAVVIAKPLCFRPKRECRV